MEQGRFSISMTYTNDSLVTDSAASAKQLATGKFAGAEMLGLNKEDNIQENIIEKARRLGKATGLVSDTRITGKTLGLFRNSGKQNDIVETAI